MNSKKERKKDVSSVRGLPESMARWNADWNGMPTVLLLLPVSGVYSVYIFSSCVYTHTQRTVLSLHTRCAYTRTDCFLRYNKRRAARSIVCVYTQCSPKRYQQVLEGLQSVYTRSLRFAFVRFPSPVKTLVMMGVATGGLAGRLSLSTLD